MNSRKIYYILFFCFCFNISFCNVFGLTCEYNKSGYSNEDTLYTITISANSADGVGHGTGVIEGMDESFKIKNWKKGSDDYWNGKVSYEASKDYTSTCPPYLFERYVVFEGSSFYLINEASASHWEEQLTPFIGKFEKSVYIDKDDNTDYNDTLTCSYESFTITYTKDGKGLSVEKNKDSDLYESPANDTVVLSQELQSMYSNWNGSCPTVCYTKGTGDCASAAGTPVCFDEYTIYYSAADTNNRACEVVNCKAGTDNCVADESGNTYNGICSEYDSYISTIESSYQGFKSCNEGDGECQGSNMTLANQNISKIESFCSSVYKIAYYSDPCVKSCTMFNSQLAQLKSTYGISIGDGGGTASCSLSERVVGWIFKIIKWIRYLVPILLILLSILDFIKAIASNSEDEMRKVGAKFVKRLIVAAIIFLLPLMLEFLLGIFNIETKDYCLK